MNDGRCVRPATGSQASARGVLYDSEPCAQGQATDPPKHCECLGQHTTEEASVNSSVAVPAVDLLLPRANLDSLLLNQPSLN